MSSQDRSLLKLSLGFFILLLSWIWFSSETLKQIQNSYLQNTYPEYSQAMILLLGVLLVTLIIYKSYKAKSLSSLSDPDKEPPPEITNSLENPKRKKRRRKRKKKRISSPIS